jgi:hypothetical protein
MYLDKCILQALLGHQFQQTQGREASIPKVTTTKQQVLEFFKSHFSSQVPKHLVTSAPSFLISSNHVTKIIQTTISYGIGQWKHDIVCN